MHDTLNCFASTRMTSRTLSLRGWTCRSREFAKANKRNRKNAEVLPFFHENTKTTL